MRTKHLRKISIWLIALVVLASFALTGCGDASSSSSAPTSSSTVSSSQPDDASSTPESAGEVGITTGIYEVRFTPEGRDEYVNYFNFYENGVFYYSAYNNGQSRAGFYEVLDQEQEYLLDAEDPESETAVAPQVLKLTNLDGSDYVTLAFDQDTIWNVPDLYNMNFAHVPDSDHDSADETGITVAEFTLGDDIYSTVRINHNGSFEDSIDTIIDGTWTKDGDVYTLTDSASGDSYTLTVSADGSTAAYVGLDGTEQTLNAVQEETPDGAEVMYTFINADKNVYMECYADGTCAVIYEGMGTITEGTWAAEGAPLPTWTIALDSVGAEPVVESDYATKFFFTFINESGQLEQVLELSFEDFQAAQQ